ncbi:hypothetical protein D049_1423B, partial [Vibrio parahaemolyticus VPTS-2010]
IKIRILCCCMPTAISTPNSLVRSNTDISMILMMPSVIANTNTTSMTWLEISIELIIVESRG